MSTEDSLREVLPHRPPMLMVDALTHCGPDKATATKTFARGSYGCEGDEVENSALIECLAQTTAAMEGTRLRQSAPASGGQDGQADPVRRGSRGGRMATGFQSVRTSAGRPNNGMLVGISGFEFRKAAHCGETLTLDVQVTRRLPPFCLVFGQVRSGATVIAEGTLKFYLEENAGGDAQAGHG